RVPAVAERLAEVAAQCAADEARVLHRQGIVEAQTLTGLVHVLGLNVHGHEEQDGIAGEAHHEEDRREGQKNYERRLGETGDDVGPHGPTVVSRCYAWPGRRRPSLSRRARGPSKAGSSPRCRSGTRSAPRPTP